MPRNWCLPEAKEPFRITEWRVGSQKTGFWFLVWGGWGAVFFIVCSYRRKQESKTKPIPSREKTMFTKCACASHVCLPRSDSTQLTLRRGPSLKVAQPVQPYIPATLWAAVAHDGQPMAQLTCPERKKKGGRGGDGFSFLPFDFTLSDDGEVTTASLSKSHL